MGITFDEEGNEFIFRLDSWRAWRTITNNFMSGEVFVSQKKVSNTGQEMAYVIKGKLRTETKQT